MKQLNKKHLKEMQEELLREFLERKFYFQAEQEAIQIIKKKYQNKPLQHLGSRFELKELIGDILKSKIDKEVYEK
jgi:hypothetical protein